jgi:hypothetical protein
MDEETALTVEASIIDFYNQFSKERLTNLDRGHDIEHGIMSDVDIKGKYSAEPIPKLSNDSVVININKRYRRGMTSGEIYEATKDSWPIDSTRIGGINNGGKIKDGHLKYVLSEYRRLIVEVFQVEYWVEYENVDYNQGSKKYETGDKRTRFGFVGTVAEDRTRELYRGKRIPIEAKSFPVLYAETINAELDGLDQA